MRLTLPPLLSLVVMLLPNLLSAQCGSVDFGASISSGCAPLSVVFGVANGPSGASYEWDLGGGFVSGKDTVFRVFVADGKKDISLRVTLSGKTTPCTTIVKSDFVEVLPKPTIDLNISDTLICTGTKSVSLADNTQNVSTREWIIDGTKLGHSNSTVQQSFGFGSHSLSLKVTNSSGCFDLLKKSKAIVVYNDEPFEICANLRQKYKQMEAAFEPNFFNGLPKQASEPDQKTPTGYAWTFTGGTPSSATVRKPNGIDYSSLTTTRDAEVTITYQGGCEYTQKLEKVITNYMAVSDTVLCIDEPVEVTNLAPGDGRKDLTWVSPGGNFLSGNTSSKFKVNYPGFGFKDIIYEFKYNSGQSACVSRVVGEDVVEVQGPQAHFRSDDRNQCSADTVMIYSRSTLPNNTGNNIYKWHIYDSDSNEVTGSPIGPKTDEDTIYFPFPKDDLYDVVLIVSNSVNGCLDSAIQGEYMRLLRPKSEMSLDKRKMCAKESIEMTDSTTPPPTPNNPYTYFWEIAHETDVNEVYTSTNEKFVKTLNVPGKYTITHITFSSKICADTIIKKDVAVVNGTVSKMTIDKPDGCVGHETTFRTNTSVDYPGGGSAPTYLWEVTPTTTKVTIASSTNSSTKIKFDSAGCYNVSVKIFNSEGCVETLSERVCIGAVANWGWDKDTLATLCLGQPLTLVDSSIVNPKHYKWSIRPASAGKFLPKDSTTGPGTTRLVFQESGKHTITMKLYSDSPLYCVDSLSHDIEIITTEAKFSVDKPLTLCAPQTLEFTNESKNAASFKWDYGDGETSTNSSTKHSYVYTTNNTSGFRAKLIAFKQGGTCTDTFELPSKVRIIGPEPKFALDTAVGCDSATVSYTNLTSPLTADFYFDYGDGSVPDTNVIKNHQYFYTQGSTADSIAFYPTIVASSLGCDAYFSDTVILYKKPTAKFSMDTAIGCSPLLVEFYNESSDHFNTYWDLNGDGTTDSTNHDTLSFSFNTGKYSPKLVVDYRGGCTDTLVLDSGIKALAIPKAQLTLSTQRGCDSLMVSFVGNNPNDSFVIEYGNGQMDIDTFRSQYYKFDTANAVGDSSTYVIKYFVTSPSLNSCSDTLWDTVRVYRQPTALFKTDTTEGCSPLEVTYINQSQNHAINSWDFDNDGIPDVLNTDTIKRTYLPGRFGATLAIETAIGCKDTFVDTTIVHVEPIPIPDISLNTRAGCDSLSVRFTINNPLDSTILNYGNGNIDTNAVNAQKFGYNAANTKGDSTSYFIEYLVMNTSLDYCRDTVHDSVGVYRQPIASFTTDTTEGCSPLQVNYYNTSHPSDVNAWDTDLDGNPDQFNLDTISHVYTSGKHGGQLAIATLNGCADTFKIDNFIEVVDIPVPDITLSTKAGCDSLAVNFTTNNPSDSFIMNYGLGIFDTNQVSGKLYGYNSGNSAGDSTTYFIQYTAINQTLDYCRDTINDSLAVYRQPIAKLSMDTLKGCEPLEVGFTNESEGDASRVWKFLNSTLPDDTDQQVSRSFGAGVYGVKLNVLSPNGCTDSISFTDTIEALGTPDIAFNSFPDTACNGKPIQFVDNSSLDTNIHSRKWTFDPRGSSPTGDTLMIPKPRVAFTSTNSFDSFTVSLRVIDSNFCENVDSKLVYVIDPIAPDTMGIRGVSFQKPAGSGSSIEINWLNNYDKDIDYIEILRVTGNDTTRVYGGIPTSVAKLLDAGLSPLKAKSFYIMNVVDSCGKISGTTKLEATYPTLKGKNSGEQSFDLEWTDQQSVRQTTRFVILRSETKNGVYLRIDSVSAGATTYSDTTLYCDAEYFYAIEAQTSLGSMITNVVKGFGKFIPPKQAPNLQLTTVIDNKNIEVTWSESNQPGHKEYIIDRYVNGTWAFGFDTTTATKYLDSSVKVGELTYEYKVYTEDVCGTNSALSNSGRSILLKAKQTDRNVEISWTDYLRWTGAYHFDLEISDASNGYSVLKSFDSNTSSFIDRDGFLNLDTPWCYRIVAVQDFGEAERSVSNEICFSVASDIFIPNAFSPNDDGINETFRIYGDALLKDTTGLVTYDMKIFDRWGERIFETTDFNNSWDGTKNGELVPVGKYLMILKTINYQGEEQTFNGYITVVK